jgi:regulator of protease activity HflC (stomatin/prohibitin superfamily)
MEKYMKRIVLVVAAIFAALAMTGCSVAANSDEIYVHKGGGIVEAPDPKGCVATASRELEKPGDSYFAYPANQRTYKFTGSQDDDGQPFSVVSKDGQTLTVRGALSFNLNTNCDVLQRFHDKIGNRYHAYMENGQTTEGWSKMLNIYLRPALDSTLDRVAKQYGWNELRSNPAIKAELDKAVNESVRALVNQQFEGNDEFFVGYSALIQQPDADPALVDAVKQNEISKAQAQATETKATADAKAAEAAAKAQVAQKNAELTVAQKEALIQKAKIAPFGSVKNWLDAQAIEKGLNPYQPTYGAGSNVLAPSK